jgi:hypothetical protein
MADHQDEQEMAELRDLPQGQSNRLSDLVKEIVGQVVEQITGEVVRASIPSVLKAAMPSVLDTVFQEIGYSGEVAGLIHLLAARSGDTDESVLRKALTLYGVALNAQEKGNRLAILSPTDEIVHEIVGFDPSELASHSLVK